MVIYKRAKASDLPNIRRLVRQYPNQLLQEVLPKYSNFFVAKIDGKMIGCCALVVYSRKMAEIRSLVVEKKYQKRGIGSHLVALCLKRAKQRKIYEVLSITSSVKLFRRLGFRTFHDQKYALFALPAKI